MFDGIGRRVVSLWFPRLATDRALRACPTDGPFAIFIRDRNADRIHCLNAEAEGAGLYRGMPLADARAYCPGLLSLPADPGADRRFLSGLRRWAMRYCPWVGPDGDDGLMLDITGAAHLLGGEATLLDDLRARLARARLTVRIGLADTPGAAWALSHHAEGLAPPGTGLAALADLPVAALRLDADTDTALRRLGLARIGQLAQTARAPLARRFGPGLLRRLDQALGLRAEEISPQPEPPHYAVRITLPEPIGLESDVLTGLARLLDRLCDKLARQQAGARVLRLTLRRVDQTPQHVTLRLARPLRDAARILPLFTRDIAGVDAGFGIDQLRLEALQVEPLPAEQISHVASDRLDRLDDLMTRIGTRIGLERLQRFHPADSHLPERSFTLIPASESPPTAHWPPARPRPLIAFPPEPIAASGAQPPRQFRWRWMSLTTLRATGPERIAPEWWRQDDNWRGGLRDYWRIETTQGRRLWMFHTPQNPGWFVQGEFP